MTVAWETMDYHKVKIYTNSSFLVQWNDWVHSKVIRHFKRDKERAVDTTQNVRLRLLSKDFIGRWFFKHLVDECVDRTQAEYMFGLKVQFVPNVSPVHGNRNHPDSIWSIRQLLEYTGFKYDRYFYSIQNHTIDSDRVLSLLGYSEKDYKALQSLYRQKKLRPSQFTEHPCSTNCETCENGKKYLKEKGISLAHDWTNPDVFPHLSKLRWNDSQLKPFLRNWKGNVVKNTPSYIMRTDPKYGIDAGLLRYAEILIDNEVVNDFKRMSRVDDMSSFSFSSSDSDAVAVSTREDSSETEVTIKDPNALMSFSAQEERHDVNSILRKVCLTVEEEHVIREVQLAEVSVKDYAGIHGMSVQRVLKIRASAIEKMRELVVVR